MRNRIFYLMRYFWTACLVIYVKFFMFNLLTTKLRQSLWIIFQENKNILINIGLFNIFSSHCCYLVINCFIFLCNYSVKSVQLTRSCCVTLFILIAFAGKGAYTSSEFRITLKWRNSSSWSAGKRSGIDFLVVSAKFRFSLN